MPNKGGGGDSCECVVDRDFNAESSNPLQNKRITRRFDKITQQLTDITERLEIIEESLAINYCTIGVTFAGYTEGYAYVTYEGRLIQIGIDETVHVPYGKNVTVYAQEIEGYITPPSVTFITEEPSRIVNFEYIPAFYINFNIEGSSECRAVITYKTIAGQQTKTVYNGDRVAVPNYCTVSITPQEQYGYDTPESVELYMDEMEKTVNLQFVAKMCNVTLKILGLSSTNLISARGTITWPGNSVELRDGRSTSIPFNTRCMLEGNSLWLSYTAPPPSEFVVDNLDYTAVLQY